MPKFYVVTKSNWQGSDWTPVAGDFPTRQDAEAKLPDFQESPTQQNGAVDIKNQVHAKVVSRTDLRNMGWTSEEHLNDVLLSEIEDRNWREEMQGR